MTTDVETIEMNASLMDAATRMRRANIGCLPVLDNDDIPIGMLTD
jgi:CBS domain-containing protein